MEQNKKNFEEMTDEQKQKVLEEVNDEVESEEGNTSITSISEMDEISKKMDEMTPEELKEHNVSVNIRACYSVENIVENLSKKNLKKVLMAILRLPEENASLTFGGTEKGKKDAEMAFIQAQVALNSKVHVITRLAAERSKQAKEDQKNQQQGEDNE